MFNQISVKTCHHKAQIQRAAGELLENRKATAHTGTEAARAWRQARSEIVSWKLHVT